MSLTDTQRRDAEPCVVAIAPCCGAMVYASVDKPEYWDAESKKELADMILEGYEVKRMPSSEVRKQKWGCRCKKDNDPQEALPL